MTAAEIRAALLDPAKDAETEARVGAELLERVPGIGKLMEATEPGHGHTLYVPDFNVFAAAVRLGEEHSLVIVVPTLAEARRMLDEIALLAEVPS